MHVKLARNLLLAPQLHQLIHQGGMIEPCYPLQYDARPLGSTDSNS